MFSYPPIDLDCREIRLLYLYPLGYHRSREAQITCTLSKALVDEATFEALSYTWGDARNRTAIVLDGVEVSVTTRLYEALTELRPTEDAIPRVLWVDALCINQSDSDERTHQVSLMAQIYSRTAAVII